MITIIAIGAASFEAGILLAIGAAWVWRQTTKGRAE